MRFVILGAGAIGGSLGALLTRAGHDVLLVARGPHGAAIRDHELRLEMPDETIVVRPPVVCPPGDVPWRDGDVVLLAVKTQDVAGAVAGVPRHVPVVCLTNGVAAERIAARQLQAVYGAYVFVPASHLVPGVVQLWASPVRGVIDVGCYPHGVDPLASALVRVLRDVGYASESRDDIMRLKRGKLLLNLGNVLEVLCGPTDGELELEARAQAEGIACFAAAGLPYELDASRVIDVKPIAGSTRAGGSTWQSLVRGKPLEVDFLNGEIVELGRVHHVPTPINTALQRLATELVERGAAPGSMSIAELEARLGLRG